MYGVYGVYDGCGGCGDGGGVGGIGRDTSLSTSRRKTLQLQISDYISALLTVVT